MRVNTQLEDSDSCHHSDSEPRLLPILAALNLSGAYFRNTLLTQLFLKLVEVDIENRLRRFLILPMCVNWEHCPLACLVPQRKLV